MSRTARMTQGVRSTAYNRVQAAYRAYIDHGRDCPVCAVDSGVCATASALWAVYQEAHDK